jgi:hypothetical protein
MTPRQSGNTPVTMDLQMLLRARTSARGYGAEHERLRRSWARTVAIGIVACARCGQLISPGEPWDLGHDDYDRTVYTGPSGISATTITTALSTQGRSIGRATGLQRLAGGRRAGGEAAASGYGTRFQVAKQSPGLLE